jgi:hypothetical protein
LLKILNFSIKIWDRAVSLKNKKKKINIVAGDVVLSKTIKDLRGSVPLISAEVYGQDIGTDSTMVTTSASKENNFNLRVCWNTIFIIFFFKKKNILRVYSNLL